MPRRVVGILSLLLVFAFKMRAQGEVVLSIGGEPVKRTEFEYYFRKSHKRTPDSPPIDNTTSPCGRRK